MSTLAPFWRIGLWSLAVLVASGSTVQAEVPEVLQYPKAKVLGGTSSTGVMECAVLLSDDPLAKVLKHYEKALAVSLGGARIHTQVDDGEVSQIYTSNEDSKQDFNGDDYPPRDVQIFTVTKVTKTDVMSLVISRTKTDEQTHIVATWLKR